MSTKKSGNKTTELIIGAGITKLGTAITTVKAVVAEFDKLETLAEEQSLRIVNAEEQLAQLAVELKNRKAQNEIEIVQAYDSKQKTFVEQYLQENQLVMVEQDDFDKLLERAEKKDEEVKKQTNEAVNAATGSMDRHHKSEIAILKLEHEKKEAGNTAKIDQLTSQISFLEGQVAHWKGMLEKQVEAETARAASKAVGAINIGSPTGK